MGLRGKNVRVRGKWWHYQFEVNGQPHSGSTGLDGSEPNRSAAEKYAEALRQIALHPSPQLVSAEDPALKGFSVAAEQFLAFAQNVEYRGKPNTAARLKTSMASCKLFFGDRRVRDLDAADIEAYKEFRLRKHGVRDITLRHDLHALSVFFRYAMKQKWADQNPIREVRIPSDRDAVREHVVTAEEENAYLTAALAFHAQYRKSFPHSQPNMHDLAVLMLEQGARPEELLALAVDAVDLAGGILQIRGGKSRGARRLLNLTERSRAILTRRLAGVGKSPWVFPSDRHPGRHLTRLQATHDRICIEAKVCFVIYDFRHTFATRAIAAGIDVPTVAAILGHSGLRTIFRYVHPTAEQKRLAMERFEAAQKRTQIKVVG